jgi:uncharacterized membrane protein
MSPRKKILLYIMTVVYVLAGAMHFYRPDDYVAMMPPFLPQPLALVYISGAAEIAGGFGLLFEQTRRYAAMGIIALLIAVFPANVYVAIDNVPMFGAAEGPGVLGWIRLPFQLLLIAWAWSYVRASPQAPEQTEQTAPIAGR